MAFLTKAQAKSEFIAIYFFNDKEHFKNSVKKDRISVAEEWNEYTDSLCKSGDISEYQYNTWANIC